MSTKQSGMDAIARGLAFDDKARAIALELEGTPAGYLLLGGRCVADVDAARDRLVSLGLHEIVAGLGCTRTTDLGRRVREYLAERDPLEIAYAKGRKRYHAAVRRLERTIARVETDADASKARAALERLEDRGRGYIDPASLDATRGRLRALVQAAEQAAAERREAARQAELERLEAEIREQRRNDWRRW